MSSLKRHRMGMDADELDICREVFEDFGDQDMEWEPLFSQCHWDYERFISAAHDYIPNQTEFEEFRDELTNEILDRRASLERMMLKK